MSKLNTNITCLSISVGILWNELDLIFKNSVTYKYIYIYIYLIYIYIYTYTYFLK